MTAFALNPGNDLVLEPRFTIMDLDSDSTTFGKRIDLPDTATVEAFLADSNLPTATAADASLVATCTSIGSGRWIVEFPGSILDATMLASLFASTTPYAIITADTSVRVAQELAYSASRAAINP